MLRKLDNKWGALAIFVLALVIGALLSPHNQPTNQIANAAANYHSDKHSTLTDFWDWITRDSISFFTFVLAIITGIQGGFIFWQIRLGRREFEATHRPRLFVQTAEVTNHGQRRTYPMGVPDNTVRARSLVRVVNGGEADFRVIERQCKIYYQSPEAAFTPRVHEETVFAGSDEWLAPAQFGSLESTHHPVDTEWEEFVNRGGRMFVIGRIFYEGRDGIRRTTGFCREYNQQTGMYHALKDSEFEYAY